MDVVHSIPRETHSASASSREGLQRAEAQAVHAAEKLAQGELNPKHMVSLVAAGHVYSANAKAVQMHDERTGQLLQMLA
ncbi:MAG: hypothetical protein ACFB20_08250 [Opitutales bacterium]